MAFQCGQHILIVGLTLKGHYFLHGIDLNPKTIKARDKHYTTEMKIEYLSKGFTHAYSNPGEKERDPFYMHQDIFTPTWVTASLPSLN